MGLFSGVSKLVKGASLGLIDMGDGQDGSRAAAAAGAVSAEQASYARKALNKGYNVSKKYAAAGYNQALGQLQPGSTQEGYASSLADIMGGQSFQPIIDQNRRTLESELANQGLTRSGAGIQEMSQVPLNTAMQIEQGLYGRKGGLADLYVNRGLNKSTLRSGLGRDLSNIYTGQGVTQSSAILAGQQANAAQDSQLMNLFGSGMSAAAAAAPALMASDIRLKENITPVGKVGPLTVYKWDWIEPRDQIEIGFIAQEVEELYPQFVAEMEGGYKGVRYKELLNELEREDANTRKH